MKKKEKKEEKKRDKNGGKMKKRDGAGVRSCAHESATLPTAPRALRRFRREKPMGVTLMESGSLIVRASNESASSVPTSKSITQLGAP
jgi:hypothetical protein